MPALCSGNDFVGIGTPYEWSGLLIMLLDELVDCGLEIGDGMEDAVLRAATGQFCEEALDCVEPQT